MKKIMMKFAAASAAFMMSISVFGSTASADFLKEDLADSWVMTENGWVFVMPDGTEAVDRLVKIDGVMYKFGNWANIYEKYSGWTKNSEGIRRRYSKGLPYTGWLKYKNGQRRYCLDGYMATDNMQIGDHIYTFDENGFYTGKTALTLITKCDKLVSSDADEIKVALKNLDGRDYNFGVLSSMERWEKGKWVNCWGDWKGENGEELAYVSIGYSLENKGDIMELDFNPQLYTNYNFTEGYYRIPIGSWIKNYKNQYECYAMLQVVPPVEVKTSENIYFDSGNGVKVDFTAEIKSDMLDSKNFEAYIFRMTADGWKDINEYTNAYGEVSTEVVPINDMQNVVLSYGMIVKDGAGYYKAVIKLKNDNKEYESYFRIGSMAASSWLDEYSKNDENLTICLNVYNSGDETKTICKDTYNLYEKRNGKWRLIEPDYELSENEPDESRYVEIKSGCSTTVYAHISESYDTSKFKIDGQGRVFAVYIEGCGFVPVALSNMELSKEDFPFADLDADELEKVKMKVWCGSTVVETTEKADDLKDIAAVLRQLELSDKAEAFPDAEGGSDEITLYYKNGKSVEIYLFSGVMRYDGQLYNVHINGFSNAISELADRIVFKK